MKKLIVIFLFILCSCGVPTWFTINSLPMLEHSYNNIDSVCMIDSLPIDLSKWQRMDLKEYESRERLTKYIIIKDTITYIRTDSNIVKRW